MYELTNTDRRRSVSKCCRGISLPSTNSSKCCLVSCLLMNLSLLCQLNLIYNNSINHTLVVCIGNGLHYLSRLFLLFSQFWIILFRSALCRFEYHFFLFLVLSTGANLIYFTQNFQLTSYITSHLIMTVILYILQPMNIITIIKTVVRCTCSRLLLYPIVGGLFLRQSWLCITSCNRFYTIVHSSNR